VAAVIAVMAITSGLLAWQNKLQRDEALAEAVVAGFVDRPGQALDEWRLIGDGVKQRIAAMSERHVQSAAYTQRIMGARSSWVAQPDAFWTSVEGGPLWENGEWLELADWPAPLPDALVQQIIDQVLNGSPNQQYAALCLMGQLDVDPALAQKAGEEVLEESEHPGVLSAAVWALRRSGLDANYPPTHVSIPDPLTGLVFVHIPASNAFQRGAEPDDPDQLPDEHREGDPVAITSFYLATTELTFAAIEPFLSDAELADEMTPLRSPLQAVSPDERDRIAAGWISLDAARAYCERLNERAIAENLPYRYRLPSEDEWEYACRAGNDGRFCYGDREEYLHYFARSRGEAVSYHRVAEHMPNAYGVFDMHGGLWERCDSPYPAAFVNEPQHQGEELFVHRGGAYYSPARRCRSTQRNYGEADSVDQYVGVRLVLEKGAP
jgi:formylglycine-generating enzyme required for sulfatase activity